MSSSRLPGKVLLPIAGRPMLGWLLERLAAARKISGVLVATSGGADDNAIAEFCVASAVNCYRGTLDDVTGRLLAAANLVAAKSFVRISGDSPFLDPALVDAIVNLFETEQPDLATNVHPRSFPKGFSVEAISTNSLERTRPMLLRGEEEHVTQVFYRRPDSFNIANLDSGNDWAGINMSVDTVDDFALAERIIRAAKGTLDRCGVAELLAIRQRCLETAE
jgi:spore coat polysaccharide biosynthesis protein SpsF